jgi:hypothetical protein
MPSNVEAVGEMRARVDELQAELAAILTGGDAWLEEAEPRLGLMLRSG